MEVSRLANHQFAQIANFNWQ